MRINIVSLDQRYKIVNELLCKDGYDAKICTPNEVEPAANCLILSVRRELTNSELEQVFSKINKETVVLCGDDDRIDKLFDGKRIVYSRDSDFLQKNANLTAEATVSFLHSLIKDELKERIVFVSGYGRIGRLICKNLYNLGCAVFAYARRKEIEEQILKDGICPLNLDQCVNADIIINTVPYPIYSKEIIDRIPKSTYIIELASYPYGFECMNRTVVASGLPGKLLPIGASRVIYDTITKILSEAETE